MRIAVNTRLLLADKLEGIGWFAHETLQRIVRAHPEHEFLFLFDRAYDERFIYAPNVTPVVMGLQHGTRCSTGFGSTGSFHDA
ncbi:MAG: hypothetical protein IPO05_00430 [Flavobacteriales bacterium]|nr:hypothetical protein [Flavobacteriales bacterium]